MGNLHAIMGKRVIVCRAVDSAGDRHIIVKVVNY